MKIRTIASLSLLLATPSVAQQLPTGAAVLPQADLQWGDFNADGLDDALTLDQAGKLSLMKNMGDGSFEDATQLAGLDSIRQAAFAVWRDYDADGKIDLFVGTRRGASHLLQNQGGNFTDVTKASGINATGSAVSAHWIDYDGDGALDLHLVSTEANTLYHALANGSFEPISMPMPASNGGNGGVVSTAGSAGDRTDATTGARGTDTTRSGKRSAGGSGTNGGGGTQNASIPGGPTITVGSGSPAGNAGNPASVGMGLCAASITDQGGGGCLEASSTPTLGMLYPLGSEFFIDDATGYVGINTTSPSFVLDVTEPVQAARTGIRVREPVFGQAAHMTLENTTTDWSILADSSPNIFAIEEGGNINNRFLVIEGDGDVGIGTSTPSATLDVNGDLNTDGTATIGDDLDAGALFVDVSAGTVGVNNSAPTFALDITEPIQASRTGIRVRETVFGQAAHMTLENTTTDWSILADSSPNIFAIEEGGSGNNRHLVIDGDGDVGIGTGTNLPETKLHVRGGNDAGLSGSTQNGYLVLGDVAGTNMVFDNNEFMSRNNGASSLLRINRDGGNVSLCGFGDNVGIGTESPVFKLEVNGSAAKTGGGSWSVSSDRRLKKNIETLDGALETLLELRGVSFEYKDPKAINELAGERLGFIAQEVETVIPDWVEDVAGYKRLTIRGFEALAVESLRELNEANEALREDNDALRSRVQALESEAGRIATVEAELDQLKAALAMYVSR